MCVLITHETHRNGGTAVRLNLEIAVVIGNHAARLSCDTDGGTDNGFAGSILHIAIDSNLLCKGSDRENQPTYQCEHPLRHEFYLLHHIFSFSLLFLVVSKFRLNGAK